MFLADMIKSWCRLHHKPGTHIIQRAFSFYVIFLRKKISKYASMLVYASLCQ